MTRASPQDPHASGGASDESLIERVRNSDTEAFRLLFERYQPIVFRAALFRTRQIDASHDVVQETFLRIWEHRSSLRPQLSFPALLYRVSGNIIRDLARRENTRDRLRRLVPVPAVSEGDDPEEALHLTQLEERLTTAINDHLPDRCRTVFLLSRFEGMTNSEIASLLGISVRTVEHQINHALRVMRRELRGYTDFHS